MFPSLHAMFESCMPCLTAALPEHDLPALCMTLENRVDVAGDLDSTWGHCLGCEQCGIALSLAVISQAWG